MGLKIQKFMLIEDQNMFTIVIKVAFHYVYSNIDNKKDQSLIIEQQ